MYAFHFLRVCLDRTYFAETENWKHCSKIIFKCVNSTVGPIFNKKIDKKWNLWVSEQCIRLLFMYSTWTVAACEGGKRVKKKKNAETETQRSRRWNQTHTKIQIFGNKVIDN